MIATAQEKLTLIWDDGSVLEYPADRLVELPFDLASWCNFARLLFGHTSYALMTVRDRTGAPHRCKVLQGSGLAPKLLVFDQTK